MTQQDYKQVVGIDVSKAKLDVASGSTELLSVSPDVEIKMLRDVQFNNR